MTSQIRPPGHWTIGLLFAVACGLAQAAVAREARVQGTVAQEAVAPEVAAQEAVAKQAAATGAVPANATVRRKTCPPDLGRPCIGLVLGGGGARGGAHLGVLRYLEEQAIPIDLVVGTSIGSFVGGLYASGLSLGEIEARFREADWDLGYQDNLPRSHIPVRRQNQLDNFPIHLDLGVGADGVRLKRGFLQGQGMGGLVESMLGVYPRLDSFDDLPIPFRAVSADIETGEEVVLGAGDLASAMQASMSIPGVVRPMEIDGRMLVDGGIANNLPVSVARALGADIIIAVDIGSPNQTREELDSGLAIVNQLASFLTLNNVREQKSLLGEGDVLLHPQIDGVSMLSFDKLLDAIDPGYAEAQRVLATRELPRDAAALAARHDAAPLETITLDQVVLSNQSRLGDDYIRHRMGFEPGEEYSLEDIQAGIGRLYGQGTIARVDTDLETTADGDVLNVDVLEKEWGPGYLDFKLSFEDNFHDVSRYQVGASYRLTNLSPYGAEWYTAGEFGTNKYLFTDFYWPLRTSGFYLEASAINQHDVFEYLDERDRPQGQIEIDELGIAGGIGWNALDQLDVLLAARFNDGDITLPGPLADDFNTKSVSYRQRGGLLRFNYDTLNDANFPSRGVKVLMNIYRSVDKAEGESDTNTLADLRLIGVTSLGRNSLRGELRYAGVEEDGNGVLIGLQSLGGFLSLSGNPKDSVIGEQLRFGSLVYTYQLAANDFGALRLPLYLGASLEAGNAWENSKAVDYDDLIYSGSVFLGWDSPIGPAYFAYGRSDTGQSSFYAFLGVLF
ncbi:patatin-like phospholipase family protein [Mangrovimicrobium sediminis]|nr:patatin-like phospholipase family protein [Haliea sp. SAOS-164]